MSVSVQLPTGNSSKARLSGEAKLQKCLEGWIKFHHKRKRTNVDLDKSVPLINKTLKAYTKKYLNKDGFEKTLELVEFDIMEKSGNTVHRIFGYNRGFFFRPSPDVNYIEGGKGK